MAETSQGLGKPLVGSGRSVRLHPLPQPGPLRPRVGSGVRQTVSEVWQKLLLSQSALHGREVHCAVWVCPASPGQA